MCYRAARRHHQHFTRAAIDIDKTFTRSRGANQAFARTLHRKGQPGAPRYGIVAVNFQHIVLQRDLNQFLFRAVGLNSKYAAAVQAQVEQSLAAGHSRGKAGAHHRFVLYTGITC